MIRVLVNGALGRMGTEVCKTVMEQKDMDLSGVVDINGAGKTIPYYDGGVFGVDTDLEIRIWKTLLPAHVRMLLLILPVPML